MCLRGYMRVGLLLGSLAWLGCGELLAQEEKLPDPDDLKADSFYKPTEHGALVHNWSVDAIMEDGHWYHQWTFELFQEAAVELVAQNSLPDKPLLVLYLYRWDSTKESWGKALIKQDQGVRDRNRYLYRIKQANLKSGLYRIIVKARTKDQVGEFFIKYSCFKEGCVFPGAGGLPCLNTVNGCLEGEICLDAICALRPEGTDKRPLGTFVTPRSKYELGYVRLVLNEDRTFVLEQILVNHSLQTEIGNYRFWSANGERYLILEYPEKGGVMASLRYILDENQLLLGYTGGFDDFFTLELQEETQAE